MTISNRIKNQYFLNEEKVIRLEPLQSSHPEETQTNSRSGRAWTEEEHNRFLEALEHYPTGPWKTIALCVRTRTTRQTMTHGQKYREKIARRKKRVADADAFSLRRLTATEETSRLHELTAISSCQCNCGNRREGHAKGKDMDTNIADHRDQNP